MTIAEISSSFSTTAIEDVLNYAARVRKQYGFIVVVLDHASEQQSHIANLTAQLYPIIKRNVRITDTIIRFAQDSWLICLDDCNDRLLEWAQYVLTSSLHRRSIQASNLLDGSLTIVRGAFLQTNSYNQAIKAFEHEIQQAKSSLRRLKMMRSSSLSSANLYDDQSNIIQDIHSAILDNRLFLAFQPIVETNSRKLHHYECLARILNTSGQILPAGQFIPSCEKTGLIQLIDQRIQQLAIEELLNNREIRLAINVSAITASDPLWLNTLKAQMTTHPNLQGRLIVELTETSVFQDIDESILFITQLRDLGCEVSIDDFGAGYMSLSHIKSDLIQSVKIDAQFVRDLTPGSNNIHFIRAIIALTQPHGIQCIAEGVESEVNAQILSSENVDFLQGYHLGRPSHFRPWV